MDRNEKLFRWKTTQQWTALATREGEGQTATLKSNSDPVTHYADDIHIKPCDDIKHLKHVPRHNE